MKLVDLIHRASPPEPWAEGDKIPWHDPDFSRRILREHLSQAHDAASRRMIIIDEQIDWIQREVLQNRSSRVLDLGCGPGLYSSRLAQRGHTCVGIDFSMVYLGARSILGSASLTRGKPISSPSWQANACCR